MCTRKGSRMGSVLVEFQCPEHGFERYKIKLIKKYNIRRKLIMPKFRTKPKCELSGIIVGRNVKKTDIEDYLYQYFTETGVINRVLNVKLQT
jgi:hypothetical protein